MPILMMCRTHRYQIGGVVILFIVIHVMNCDHFVFSAHDTFSFMMLKTSCLISFGLPVTVVLARSEQFISTSM